MKRIYILFLGFTLICLCAGITIYFNQYTYNEYIIFSSSKNPILIEKLEKNKIPYKLDKSGNVKIMEEGRNRATLCCT
ncbi:hypothetical protein [Bacillus cereus]|uniref:Uncharacterized protein n=1 Tax=Bacillus cereus TaxID=1396 RepID=A0A1S9UDH9_BACCE|nr:hypothetical protein [Bacillus cereus]OOR19791.1 hypothetical protein BW892_24930 [Bacillus cereus]